ncbi:nucleoside-diphosphate sugar epimerase/dehydratase [Azotosporobacter soli]|uniref:polysaccharide biosynthesis protein n=1 Tax=Azotosporobacter soli TaxID=3055040 RepID=UPI0031FF120B
MEQALKITGLLATDFLILILAPYTALLIRMEGNYQDPFFSTLYTVLPIFILIGLTAFYFSGLYRRMWRYASVNEVVAILNAVLISVVLNITYLYIAQIRLPYSFHFINALLLLTFVGGTRFCVRMAHYFRKRQEQQNVKNVLIYGAGDAGAMLAREIQHQHYGEKRLVGFIDDAEAKRNRTMFGIRVIGNRSCLREVVEDNGIHEIIVAMPSINGIMLREIIRECKNTKCSVKILPESYGLHDGKVSMQELRNVDLEDLLRRDPVHLDLEQITAYLRGKRVLVTGAGGSIGSELCRQIIEMMPQTLILLGRGENSIYEIEYELRNKISQIEVVPLIGDIRDAALMEHIFEKWHPQVVFHAAAHKHVPLMEAQPVEAIKNNVFGTKNVAEAAKRFQCEIFVMISTDKAVNPTSVMGATKRVAELIIRQLNGGGTKFVAVRFGNVLGSRGSVIPLFKKQIAQGGPITITHPDMKRYFMTIPEASQLVLQAGAMAQGGEVFVLDMGDPVNIKDMACDLIELSGLEPYNDIAIEFTGLRPGEKLFEELLNAEEGTAASKHEKIYIANLNPLELAELERGMRKLESVTDRADAIEALMEMLSTYCDARKKHGIQ